MANAVYLGIDGVARNSDTLYVGVDAVSRTVVSGYIGVDAVARQFWVWPPVALGTQWVITEDCEWECPANGVYLLELHGGGGAGYAGGFNVTGEGFYASSGSGGGSGEMFQAQLIRGEKHALVIGRGAKVSEVPYGSTSYGGTTSFGNIASIAGGSSGYIPYGATGRYKEAVPGQPSGSLATGGSGHTYYCGNMSDLYYYAVAGGLGNASNPTQTYGNGGAIKAGSSSAACDGEPGAIIITYLGKP